MYRPSPPLSPASMDSAVAEIAARQSELDNPAPRAMAPRNAPPIVPGAPQAPDFSSLERYLIHITGQLESLQRPDTIDQSITGFRNELSEIRAALTEAMPRRAIESIENDIRSLTRRIDDNRLSAVDGQAMASIERALSDIREVLGSLTPAEHLAGYDEAIRNLGAKLDTILRANDDPSTVHQLESAITALRGIASNIASNDALVRLSEDVHLLSSKVDQLTRAGQNSDSFALLEQRIASLASLLESRERPVASGASEDLEGALRALSDRIDRLQVGNDGADAFAHLEQRVTYLLERLETSGDRSGNLGRVEHGLQDILRQLESQHAAFTQFAETSRNAFQPQELIARFRPDRPREARTIRHALQPDGGRPHHPGFAGSRPQHARPCGRPAGDDRRRSAQRPHRAGCRAAGCAGSLSTSDPSRDGGCRAFGRDAAARSEARATQSRRDAGRVRGRAA